MISRREVERLKEAVRADRLVATAVELIAAPSPTGRAGEALDRLAQVLERDGFRVERPDGGHAAAPAVAARLESGKPGRVLQIDGHLDTVHLPFVPPSEEGGLLRGSGAADMKAGVAAGVEALRALREVGLPAGSVLLTAHDLHEAPWGRGEQLDRLIDEGLLGDAVLLPEPLSDRLAVVGRGAATFRAQVSRPGPAVHEVMRPAAEPDPIAAAARLVLALGSLGERLSSRSDPLAGAESVFVGQLHAGEIYNGFPREAWLEGTRRWLPGTSAAEAERSLEEAAAPVAEETGARIELDFRLIRDAFRLDLEDPLVIGFDEACRETSGATLPRGPKPFVDDGNCFWARAGVAAITHGPRAGGQHTTSEWVSIEDLARLARLYAATALCYCPGEPARPRRFR